MRYMLILGIVAIFLQGCASYVPIVDSNGRSGTFDNSKAEQITNDLIICKKLAENNTNNFAETGKVVYNVWWRASTLWLSDKLEYTYPKIYRNCVSNRGHSVVN